MSWKLVFPGPTHSRKKIELAKFEAGINHFFVTHDLSFLCEKSANLRTMARTTASNDGADHSLILMVITRVFGYGKL